jgi:hypothetical protein
VYLQTEPGPLIADARVWSIHVEDGPEVRDNRLRAIRVPMDGPLGGPVVASDGRERRRPRIVRLALHELDTERNLLLVVSTPIHVDTRTALTKAPRRFATLAS